MRYRCVISRAAGGGAARHGACPMLSLLLLLPLSLLLLPSAQLSSSTPGSKACLDHRGVPGPCAPGREYCGQPFTLNAPAYHLMSTRGCAENDPNAPAFDPAHGVIHHFYQDHLASPPGSGPVWGHFVSKDFVFWAELPVAIWNGIDASTTPARSTVYDTMTIATGSAALVPGAGPPLGTSEVAGAGLVIIYSAYCNRQHMPHCGTGTLLAMAVPADYAGDELLTNWSKPLRANPIANNTQRDPSSPWKTPSGEWRLRTYDGHVYASASDADLLAGKWLDLGANPDFPTAECPSLYPLPGSTPGYERHYDVLRRNGALPSHVQKTSSGGKDWWQLGTYLPGPRGVLGSFKVTTGWADVFKPRMIDAGAFYASKDNHYPTRHSNDSRRINWGWAMVPPASTQTLPRQITFNPVARTLEQAPLPELEALRQYPAAAHITRGQLTNGGAGIKLGTGVTIQSEVVVRWQLPVAKTDMTVVIGTVPPPPPPQKGRGFVRGMDVGAPAVNYNITHYHQANTTAMALRCQAACDADTRCSAWTFGNRNTSASSDPCRFPGGCCCLKTGAIACLSPNPLCISGLQPRTAERCGNTKPPIGHGISCTIHFVPQNHQHISEPYNEIAVSCGGVSDTLRLLPSERYVELRMFVDHTVAEAYFQGGRVAMTSATALDDTAHVLLTTEGASVDVEVTMYKMRSIWVTPDAVRNASRVYV